MGFNEVTAAGQDFSENTEIFGEVFSYTAPNGGATTSGLVGVFNQVELTFTLADFSFQKITALLVVSSKPQWGAVVPDNRGTVSYNGVGYQIEKLDGTNTPAEPAYGITLKKLT